MAVALFVFVMWIFLEVLEIWDNHSCGCTCSAIAIRLDVMGSCLKVSLSGGSSLKETSLAISAKVLTWKVPVWLITTGIIFKFALGCRKFVVLVGAFRR